MKKLSAALCIPFSLLLFAGCGGSNLSISIGDGLVPNDAVTANINYSDTWKDQEVIFSVSFSHESEAVLADEYQLALSDVDPLFSDSHTFITVASVTKEQLTSFKQDVKFEDLSGVLPQGDGTCSVWLVFYSTDTDFDNITTFGSHEFQYEWQGEDVKLVN